MKLNSIWQKLFKVLKVGFESKKNHIKVEEMLYYKTFYINYIQSKLWQGVFFNISRNKNYKAFLWKEFKSKVNNAKINVGYLHTELCRKTAKINGMCSIFTNFQ